MRIRMMLHQAYWTGTRIVSMTSWIVLRDADSRFRWHFLNFLPEPHQQGAFLPNLGSVLSPDYLHAREGSWSGKVRIILFDALVVRLEPQSTFGPLVFRDFVDVVLHSNIALLLRPSPHIRQIN